MPTHYDTSGKSRAFLRADEPADYFIVDPKNRTISRIEADFPLQFNRKLPLMKYESCPIILYERDKIRETEYALTLSGNISSDVSALKTIRIPSSFAVQPYSAHRDLTKLEGKGFRRMDYSQIEDQNLELSLDILRLPEAAGFFLSAAFWTIGSYLSAYNPDPIIPGQMNSALAVCVGASVSSVATSLFMNLKLSQIYSKKEIYDGFFLGTALGTFAGTLTGAALGYYLTI